MPDYDGQPGLLQDPNGNLMAKLLARERTGSAAWQQPGPPMDEGPIYYGGIRGSGGMPASAYNDEIMASQAAQQALAAEAYGAAGEAGMVRGAQLRGQALTPAMGEVLGGDALASRQAMMGATRAGLAGSIEGVRQSSGDRLASAEAYMSAQQRKAEYEQAAYQRWLDYLAQQRQADDIKSGAKQTESAAQATEADAQRKIVGASMGAVGAAMGGGM